MKRCPVCCETKPLEDFFRANGKAGGRGSYCKPCTVAKRNAYRKTEAGYQSVRRSELKVEAARRALRSRRKPKKEKPPPKRKSVRERFEERYCPEPNTGCWLWMGTWSGNGYGQLCANGERRPAHQVSLELVGISIPSGMQVDHLCKTKLCVNPEHLQVVTPRENTLRSDGPSAQNARKTHCKHGHSLTGDNLYVAGNHRWCKLCRHEAVRRARGRAREVQQCPY